MTEPVRDRPEMPPGYGVDSADSWVSFGDVETQLRNSESYWLATTRPDSRPHVVPRWGVWIEDRFWYDGSPNTIHARNLAHNSACALHLESGNEVVIVEGHSHMANPITPNLGERLAREYARKYAPRYTPSPDQWSDADAGGMRVLVALRVLAWTDFPNDLTRFTFMT